MVSNEKDDFVKCISTGRDLVKTHHSAVLHYTMPCSDTPSTIYGVTTLYTIHHF